MAAIIPAGEVVWGIQLPIQSQSTIYVQDWEPGSGPAELALIAQAADRAGAAYVAVCDHVGIPRPADESMSSTWYDTVATLAWLGALTERVWLLSHVYVLAYRHPLVTAKAFATLDHLTGGRAVLGVGAGHLASEFEVLGVDHADRGPATDRAIEVIRAAFEEEYPTIGGPGAEVGVGYPPFFSPIDEEDSLYVIGTAAAYGLRGFNLYMAVERDRWVGAPIGPHGEARPFARRLTRLLEALEGLVPPTGSRGTIFRSDHASNYLPLKGNLPRDRGRLLDELSAAQRGEVRLRPEWARGL